MAIALGVQTLPAGADAFLGALWAAVGHSGGGFADLFVPPSTPTAQA